MFPLLILSSLALAAHPAFEEGVAALQRKDAVADRTALDLCIRESPPGSDDPTRGRWEARRAAWPRAAGCAGATGLGWACAGDGAPGPGGGLWWPALRGVAALRRRGVTSPGDR